LALYLRAVDSTPPDTRSLRESLVAELQAAPESAERWIAFLRHEENTLSASTNPLEAATTGGRHGVTLFHLYEWATKTVPRRGNYNSEAYLQIWLGYARHQGYTNEEDARDTFKTLKDQCFGEKSAYLYREWARFEASKGHWKDAIARLRKGMKAGAEPAKILKDAAQELQKDANVSEVMQTGPDRTRTPAMSTGSMSISTNSLSASDASDSVTATFTVTAGLAPNQRPTETPTIGSRSLPPRPCSLNNDDATLQHRRSSHAEPRTQGVNEFQSTSTADLSESMPRANPGTTPGNSNDGASVLQRNPPSSGKPLKRLAGLRGLGGPARRVMASIEGADPLTGTTEISSPSKMDGCLTSVASLAEPSAGNDPDSDGSSGRKRKAVVGDVQPPPIDELKRRPDDAPKVGFETNRDCHDRQPALESVSNQGIPCEVAASQPAAPSPREEEAEDTVPICDSSLAQRVLKGRPSVAPPRAGGTAQQVQLGDGATSEGQSSRGSVRQGEETRDGEAAPCAEAAPSCQAAVQPVRQHLSHEIRNYAGHPHGASEHARHDGRHAHVPLSQPERANGARSAAEPEDERPQSAGGQQAFASLQRLREDDKSIIVKGVRYSKLEVVGRGGSSKVFKVIAPNHQIFALKRIRLHGRDMESASGFVDEIRMLHKLRKKENIIQLIDAEVVEKEKTIFLVLEFGEIDLATMLTRKEKLRASGQEELDENFIRLYWQQMLQAVATIHEERIVHSDLKPANFIFVKGQLKLLDFGIAKAMQTDTTSIVRENQVGTLNYMSPEAILGGNNNIRGAPPMRVGRASDIWSLGCILYQMVYGATPFASLPFIQKMHAITDPNHPIKFPHLDNSDLLDLIRSCLDRNPRTRIPMEELLSHPFLHPNRTKAPLREGPATAPQTAAGMTKAHLQAMLEAMVTASGGRGSVDVSGLADDVFYKLSIGEQPDFAGVISAAIQAARRPPLSAAADHSRTGRAAHGGSWYHGELKGSTSQVAGGLGADKENRGQWPPG